jgi:hypothetical protein|tara:strand:- start:36 stop:263 length:228 start_codon:yes stop_codon:yes gene_type:complete
MEMEPQTEREHIISIQGHITGVKREVENLKQDVSHVHRDVEKLGGKIDKIYWVVLSIVGAVGLMVIEKLIEMVGR